MSKKSTESAAQSRKHLLAGYQLNFTALDLANSTVNFEPPRLINIGIRRAIQRLDQRKREFGSLSIGQPGRLLFHFGEDAGHITPQLCHGLANYTPALFLRYSRERRQ
jgi:hypothetical protein